MYQRCSDTLPPTCSKASAILVSVYKPFIGFFLPPKSNLPPGSMLIALILPCPNFADAAAIAADFPSSVSSNALNKNCSLFLPNSFCASSVFIFCAFLLTTLSRNSLRLVIIDNLFVPCSMVTNGSFILPRTPSIASLASFSKNSTPTLL